MQIGIIENMTKYERQRTTIVTECLHDLTCSASIFLFFTVQLLLNRQQILYKETNVFTISSDIISGRVHTCLCVNR
jgi:hypothetical protein